MKTSILDELRKRVLRESINPMFEAFGIDEESGILSKQNDTVERRYAGYPYIGSRYAEQDVKVVIVGADIGSDELQQEWLPVGLTGFKDGTYLRFERIDGVEETCKTDRLPSNFTKCCAHMAGTYATVITLLKDGPTKQMYEEMKIAPTARRGMRAIRDVKSAGRELVPLFCMTNVHKLVTKDRKGRAGGNDRVWIDSEKEFAFLKAELIALEPTVVVFQEPRDGNLSRNQYEDLEKSLVNCRIIRLLHPSTRKKGGYLLKEDIEEIINETLA